MECKSHETQIIRLNWKGPYKHKDIDHALAGEFGIYQIYGPHQTYCSPQLLYIGLSIGSLASRVLQHEWATSTRDSSQVAFYFGALESRHNDSENELKKIERLLIYAHFPSYNTQKWAAESDASIADYHILNFGDYRDLLPEVSGLRWYIRKPENEENRN